MQVTLRVALPLWQADHAPVCHITAAQAFAAAHGLEAAGAAAAEQLPPHCVEPGATARPPLMHWTVRVAVPVPHVAPQVLQSPATHSQAPHLSTSRSSSQPPLLTACSAFGKSHVDLNSTLIRFLEAMGIRGSDDSGMRGGRMTDG